MLTGRDIIYISSIEWNFLWQQNQEIAVRLARAGNRVLYIENTGVRSPGLGDAGRVFARLKGWIGKLGSQGVREVAPNVYVCSPLVLPPFGSRFRTLINRHILLPMISRSARRLGLSDVLLWTYLPTDTVLDIINLLRTPQSATVYYCLADFPELTPDSDRIGECERLLVEQSDVVFANCTKISKRLSAWKDRVDVFPPGVDLEAFPAGSAIEGSDSPAEEWASLPRPIIGYIGGLHRHVDFDLIADMAEARPDWSWVLVGPLQTSAERLADYKNVYLAGARSHEELAIHVYSFDVCMVPYLQSPYTETVVPVKINEYLAAGKPVVSSDLPTVVEFNDRHHILITAENKSEGFLRGIETALDLPTDPATRARRREVAALCDWNVQIEAMSKLIQNQLDKKRG
jgi:glycosyltransferase involved in cell wall biosynthesis